MFMATARTLGKSYRATKNADSSGHCLHCYVSWLHAPESHSQLTDPPLRTDCFGVSLPTDWPSALDTPNWLTLCSRVSLPNDRPCALDRLLWGSHSQLTNPQLRTDCFGVSLPNDRPTALDWLLWGLTPNWLTLFILLFWSCRFLWAQLFGWSSCQSRQRKVFWTLQCRFKDNGDKVPSLATHPRTYPYMYIYIHTHTHTHTHKFYITD